MKNKRVGIIGGGTIASGLHLPLEKMGVKICFTLRRGDTGVSFENLLEREKPDCVFLAISTLDKGEAARDYVLACMRVGIPVVTCEKGALAYHSEVLQPYFSEIGFNATVGGGSRILEYLQSWHFAAHKAEIHAVLNGTLNFIFDEVRRYGRTLDEACASAIKLGYAEPGTRDTLDLLNRELLDVVMKMCILFNTTFAIDRLITPDDFLQPVFVKDDLAKLTEEAETSRLVVSFIGISQKRPYLSVRYLCGFRFNNESRIEVGLHRITDASNLDAWLPSGVYNAVHIIDGAHRHTLSGPGAGVETTVRAMLADFSRLCP